MYIYAFNMYITHQLLVDVIFLPSEFSEPKGAGDLLEEVDNHGYLMGKGEPKREEAPFGTDCPLTN